MNKIDFKKILPAIILFLLLFVSFRIFIVIFENYDMREHANQSRMMITGEYPVWGNFIFCWLVNIFSFFSVEKGPSETSLCFLLALATSWKYYWIQLRMTELNVVIYEKLNAKWNFILLSLSLIFVYIIPFPSILAHKSLLEGNFVPTSWHNSTIIFLFPFALILYHLSCKQLDNFDIKRTWLLVLFVFLNIYIKPSYFFVYGPVFSLFLLIRYKFNKPFWIGMIPVVLGILFLAIEYWIIYQTPHTGEKPSSVVINPFFSYKLMSPLWLFPFAFFSSVFFPVCYALLNFSRIKSRWKFWFTALSYSFAVFIYMFLAESGPRERHGNFYWQIVICSWLCFFVALSALLKDVKESGFSLKNKLLFIAYFLHVLVGVAYFIRLFIPN